MVEVSTEPIHIKTSEIIASMGEAPWYERLFVDGRKVAESTAFDPADYDLTSRQPLRIGFGANDYFHGRLSDVRLYGRALNSGEIARLAKAP